MGQQDNSRVDGVLSPSQKEKATRKARKTGGIPSAKDVQIGRVHQLLSYVDTATHFGIHNISLEKTALAEICGCGVEDKCWAVPQSRKQ